MFPVLVYPLRVTFTRTFFLTALIGASTLLRARQKPPFSGVCAHANQLITAAMSSIASEEDADEEEEHGALPVFSPSRPARAAGPIAVPGAAQLLIPPPAPLNGRGLALSSYPSMALVSTACLSMLERACAGPAGIPSPEQARAGVPERTPCFLQARRRPQLRFKGCQVLKRKRILEEVTVR
jgi:hypothetical protein